MIVWLVLTCHWAAVLSVLSHCCYLWGNWMCVESMYTISMSFLLTPLFCSISDESLLFFQVHILSFLPKNLSLVCTSDREDGSANLLLLFISQGPCRPQGDHTAVLHVSEDKNCCVSVDTASSLTVLQSPIPDRHLYFCSMLLSQWRFGPTSCVKREQVLDRFCLEYFLLCVCFLAHTIS